MRAATVRAAMRRGWVWPIWPVTPRPSSRQILGSWVVLPDPVSPATMTTWWSRIASAMSSLALADRQLFGIGELRERGAAPCDPLRGAGDVIGELCDRLVLGGLIAQAAGPVDTPVEPVLVGQHQLGQCAAQVSERGQRRYLVHRRERVDDRTRVVPTLFRAADFPGGQAPGAYGLAVAEGELYGQACEAARALLHGQGRRASGLRRPRERSAARQGRNLAQSSRARLGEPACGAIG